MRIASSKKKTSLIFRFSEIKNRIFKKKITSLTVIYLLILAFSLAAIFEVQSIFYTYQKVKTVALNSFQITKNYISSIDTDIETLDISISHKNKKKLEYIKSMSAEHYIGLDNTDPVSLMRKEWVPGEINYDGKNFRVEIRIKGQSVDHWGKHPSYKIKVRDGKTIMGMKRFALQHPKTRGFMNEWYFHKFLKFNDLISLRYDFIHLSINGDDLPIFALEENFGKRLIENNKRKDGLIFRIINQGDGNRIVKIQQPQSEINRTEYMKNGVDDLNYKLELFFDDKIDIEKVFDLKSMAKLFAIADLWGNRHALQLKNTRFYYNPVTSLIEPIAYDQQVIYSSQLLGLMGQSKKVSKKISYQSEFFDILFNNSSFYKEYIRQLERISNKELLDNFFKEIFDEEQEVVRKIYKSYPYYEYKSIYPSLEWIYQDRNNTRHLNSIWLPREKNALYKNQEYIRQSLKLNEKSLSANLIDFNSTNNMIELRLTNHESHAIALKAIKIKGNNDINITIEEEVIIDPKDISNPDNFKDVSINFPGNEKFDKKFKDNLFVEVNILGSADRVWIPVYEKYEVIYTDKLTNYTNLENYQGIVIDKEDKIINFIDEVIDINEDLIIEPGFRIYADKGTIFNLKNNANIISYSPLYFVGTEEKPLIINSRSGGSISLINTEEKSVMSNIVFNNLSEPDYKHLNISGGINFYQSDIELSFCFVNNSDAEDGINVVRSSFTINNCVFQKSKSDALDIDFSNGSVTSSSFINSGNDSIDLSASIVKLEDIKIINSLDKGISIGEQSLVNINHIDILNSKIALAVKDRSKVLIDKNFKGISNGIPFEGIIIKNCEYGIAVYQKKPEYGPAEVFIGSRKESYKNLIIEETVNHFIVERGSFLEIGSQRVENYKDRVFESLYN